MAENKTAEGSAVCGIRRISEFDAHAGGQFAGTDVFDSVDFADVVVAVAGIQIDIRGNGIAYARQYAEADGGLAEVVAAAQVDGGAVEAQARAEIRFDGRLGVEVVNGGRADAVKFEIGGWGFIVFVARVIDCEAEVVDAVACGDARAEAFGRT